MDLNKELAEHLGNLPIKVTVKEYLKGREVAEPLTEEMERNALTVLVGLNLLRHSIDRSVIITSGYRPPSINAAVGGAKRSAHLLCQAADIADPDGSIYKWVIENQDLVKSFGFRGLEHRDFTPNWLHLDTVQRYNAKGEKIFIFRAK